MVHFRVARTGRLFMTALMVVGTIAFFAVAANAEPIVVLNGTSGSQTLYSYNPDRNTVYDGGVEHGKTEAVATLNNDATLNGMEWGCDAYDNGAVWLQPNEQNVAKTVTWHLQAAAGHTIGNDVAVTWNMHFIQWTDNQADADTTSDYMRAQWSTNGSDWTAFADKQGTKGQWWTGFGETTALNASGYAGGSDLYLRFTVYRAVGNMDNAQLFRTDNPNSAPFVVSGTVSAIPEPTTAVLLGSGVLGLMAYAWRKRK